MAIIAVVVTRCRMREREERNRQWEDKHRDDEPAARKLDVAAFRADLAQRKAKVEALKAADKPAPPQPYEPPKTTSLVTLLVSPECAIGPGELCKSLEGVIVACDTGDGAACLAVAQYLQDTPPRPRAAVMTFLLEACKRREASACARLEELKKPFSGTCVDDPVACSMEALRTQNRYTLGQACEAGVAETCAWLAKNVGNPDARRRYLEASCQLGDAAACTQLGQRLSATCEGEDCYEPDAEQAAAALAIGCAAGYADACKER